MQKKFSPILSGSHPDFFLLKPHAATIQPKRFCMLGIYREFSRTRWWIRPGTYEAHAQIPTPIARFMGPTWAHLGPTGGPHVGPMNFAIWLMTCIRGVGSPVLSCNPIIVIKVLNSELWNVRDCFTRSLYVYVNIVRPLFSHRQMFKQ